MKFSIGLENCLVKIEQNHTIVSARVAQQGNGKGTALTKLEACVFASVLTLKTQVGGESYDSSLVLPH